MRKHLVKISAMALSAALALLMVSGGTAKAQANGYCHDPKFGGTFWCNLSQGYTSAEALFTFPNQTVEIFVIGTDDAVWTRWTNTSGGLSSWVSLGGLSIDPPPLFYIAGSLTQFAGSSNYAITLVITWTSGAYYYKQRGPNSSSGWTTNWQPFGGVLT
jgi:hypothetical protein